MKAAKIDERNLGWARKLADIDREVARLAAICNVRILDPGAIERVLRGDETVCATRSPSAFRSLRHLLMLHYHVRDDAVAEIGQAETSRLVLAIVERLKRTVGDRLGGPPA